MAIGIRRKLDDGAAKASGRLKYCGDFERPEMLHARLVTSAVAHGTLRGLDLAAATRVPGVVAVLTADDLPEIPASNRATLLLARKRVRFVGQPVALVLAETERAAQDGAEAVWPDFEEHPAAVDLDATLEPDAPAVWPEGMPGQSAEAAAHGAGSGDDGDEPAAVSPNVAGRAQFDRGDVGAALRDADLVVEREFRTAAVHQSYLEPHVSIAEMDPMGQGVTVWTSTQATYYVRDAVAGVLSLPVSSVRVVGTPVGGGFGGKFLLYEPLLALAARHTGRPVRLELSRLEEMTSATPAPPMRIRISLGARRSGELVALDAEMVMDSGCFPTSMQGLAGALLGSNYRFEHLRVVGLEVLTHRASAGAYRAPCAPQCAFALESAVDEVARRLELDPIELRLRNAARSGDPMAFGRPWPSMGMTEVLEALREHPAWRDREERRAAGRGVGVAVAGWPGGTEPAAAACSLQGDGTLQVHVGSVDITGTNTGLAMLAGEAFGVPTETVKVVAGDTASAPFAGSSGGSKILYTVGPAVIQAAEDARRQTLELASQILEAAIDDLEIVDGAVQVKGSPDHSLPLAKIARKTMAFGSKLAPIFGHGRHAQPDQSPGFSAQLAEVSVDRETGAVTVHRLVVVQDVGRAINPLLVEGQMHGGAIQGIGWALREELAIGDGGQVLSATFSDYALPHFADLPEQLEIQMVEVPSPLGPFGARGVGEPPVIPTAAAVANAIHDVVAVRPTELPISASRLHRLLVAEAAP